MRSKDAQKQLARTSLSTSNFGRNINEQEPITETKAVHRDVTKRCDFGVLVLISDWTIIVGNSSGASTKI